MDLQLDARARNFAELQKIDLRRADGASEPANSKAFAENEARLKSFYRSGEPETTQGYTFIDVCRPCTVKVASREAGLGLFLSERAVPGQLLIVENAKVSCSCVAPEYTPFEAGSYIHAPKSALVLSRPRIPAKVHIHLTTLLIGYCASPTRSLDILQMLNLDSQDRTCVDGIACPTEWSIVANNAMCDRVRCLSSDEPRLVQADERWGVWLLPSYINHSCAPNCHRMRVGEAMLVRAATNIAAGEELTLPYFDIFVTYFLRSLNCFPFGFRCDCHRCALEAALGKSYMAIQEEILTLKVELDAEWRRNMMVNCGSGGGGERGWKSLLGQMNDLLPAIGDMVDHLMDDGRIRPTEGHWILASFIDVRLAGYACTATDACGGVHDVVDTLEEILEIINEVHPGNLLGQELYSALLNALQQSGNACAECEKSAMRFYSSYFGYPGAQVLKLLLAIES